jgi:hypothetical protein
MAEQEVVEAFRKMGGWYVEHRAFYRDNLTGKVRELDVRARRRWSDGGGIDGRDAALEVLRNGVGHRCGFKDNYSIHGPGVSAWLLRCGRSHRESSGGILSLLQLFAKPISVMRRN